MGYAVSTSAGTVADRVVDFLKRAGESTPREIQDALDVHQTELPKALEVAIREGAIVKRKDERRRVETVAHQIPRTLAATRNTRKSSGSRSTTEFGCDHAVEPRHFGAFKRGHPAGGGV